MHNYDFRTGEVLLIRKPLTWTSFQVVNKLKYMIKHHASLQLDGKRVQPKIGHAGTLDPVIQPKEITISEFEITRIALPEIDFRVVCSKGTYIRSLARDYGVALGSGAHLTALCRTRIGNYKLDDAVSLEEVEQHLKSTVE